LFPKNLSIDFDGQKDKFFLNAEERFFIIEAVQGAAGKLVIILSLRMTRKMRE